MKEGHDMNTKMQVGIRLHDVEYGTIEQRVKTARAQGFKCAHIALAKLIDDYSTDDAALTPGLAMYLRKLFAENNMDIAVLGCYLNLATPDPSALRANVERYKAHMRFASLLQCGVVGSETGAPNVGYSFEPACRSEESLKLFIERVRPVVEYAEKCGVIFALEPVTKHICYSAERLRRVLDEINSPNLQVILDPLNLIDETNVADYKAVVRNAIDVLGKDVAVVHIKDFNIVNNKVVSCAAGTGIMDYTDLVNFIEKEKPYIQCTLEDTVPQNAEAARIFMENGAVRP